MPLRAADERLRRREGRQHSATISTANQLCEVGIVISIATAEPSPVGRLDDGRTILTCRTAPRRSFDSWRGEQSSATGMWPSHRLPAMMEVTWGVAVAAEHSRGAPMYPGGSSEHRRASADALRDERARTASLQLWTLGCRKLIASPKFHKNR